MRLAVRSISHTTIARVVARAAARAVATLAALAVAGTLPAQQIATGAPHPLLVASNSFGQLNPSQATIVGQTFTAPQLTRLDAFQFHLSSSRDFGNLSYRAFVAAWDPTSERVTGPILYQSDLTVGTASELPVLTTFVTGGIAVTPGQLYIAFFATPELAGTPQLRFGRVHRVVGDTYAAGTARVATAYNGTVASILDARFTPVGDDFAFTATFSAPVAASVVPEPTTVLLFGGGLLGLGAVTRRRRTAR